MALKEALKKFVPYSLGIKIRDLWQKALRLFYMGNRYYCPYCKNSFRKFLTGGYPSPIAEEKKVIGSGRRRNMLCPRCYSTDRDRLVYVYLKEKTNFLKEKARVLHIAPERTIKQFLSSFPNIDYVAGDKFEEGYRGYYYDRDVQQMDVTSLPFGDNSFDLVICNHVLEHIKDDFKALSEIKRVLKPGGKAILQVPVSIVLKATDEEKINDPEEREKRFGQFDHMRLYALDYRYRLEKAGFQVEVSNPEQEGWSKEVKKLALNPLEDIYVGIK